MKAKIRLLDPVCMPVDTGKGECFDLVSRDTVSYKAGDIVKIHLGICIEPEDGYYAKIYPRSSTFKNFRVKQTNSVGIIDHTYCGDNDEWMVEFNALEDGEIRRGSRVAQGMFCECPPKVDWEVVDHLGNADRGGFGSTGKR